MPLPQLARASGLSPAATQASLLRLMASGVLDASPNGRVADVLVKPGSLSRRELAELSQRFQSRAALEKRHLEDVGRYASLTTCRRALLLSHFGDEAARFIAPCDGCDVCGEGSSRAGSTSLLGRLIRGVGEAFGLNPGRAASQAHGV